MGNAEQVAVFVDRGQERLESILVPYAANTHSAKPTTSESANLVKIEGQVIDATFIVCSLKRNTRT